MINEEAVLHSRSTRATVPASSSTIAHLCMSLFKITHANLINYHRRMANTSNSQTMLSDPELSRPFYTTSAKVMYPIPCNSPPPTSTFFLTVITHFYDAVFVTSLPS